MRKTTQRELKNMIATGFAADITHAAADELPKVYSQIAYSAGAYGINGALFETPAGELFAVVGREKNLYRLA